jgi:diguanylate cyclase (GGDEF)-like protein
LKFIDSVKLCTRVAIISNLAYKDGLTDLYNRTSYHEDLDKFEKDNHSVGIVMLDINNLKYVNDTYGHDEGDNMLLTCAKILKRAYNKPNMKIYRIGGDEFVVIIDSINGSIDYEYCDDRMKRLYQDFNINTDKRFKIVISSGFCQYSALEHSSIEDAVRNADLKMYECKKTLKQYRYFNVMV